MAEVRAVTTVPVTSQFSGLGAPSPCSPLLYESTAGKLYVLLTPDTVLQVGNGVVVAAGLTAVGTVQADAYSMTGTVNEFTSVATGTGARLSSTMTPGDSQLVFNGGANTLNIYPDSGSRINALATNAATTLASSAAERFTRASTTLWIAE